MTMTVTSIYWAVTMHQALCQVPLWIFSICTGRYNHPTPPPSHIRKPEVNKMPPHPVLFMSSSGRWGSPERSVSFSYTGEKTDKGRDLLTGPRSPAGKWHSLVPDTKCSQGQFHSLNQIRETHCFFLDNQINKTIFPEEMWQVQNQWKQGPWLWPGIEELPPKALPGWSQGFRLSKDSDVQRKRGPKSQGTSVQISTLSFIVYYWASGSASLGLLLSALDAWQPWNGYPLSCSMGENWVTNWEAIYPRCPIKEWQSRYFNPGTPATMPVLWAQE